MPNITGQVDWWAQGATLKDMSYSGALSGEKGSYSGCGYAGNSSIRIKLNASQSNSIYGNSNTVQPFSVYVYYCIKY